MGKRTMDLELTPALVERSATKRAGPVRRRRGAPLDAGASRSEPNAELVETIVDQVIPRLILAHRMSSDEAAGRSVRRAPTEAEVEVVAEAAVRHDAPRVLGVADAMSREGLRFESILLELIAPAARLLGVQWSADGRSFTEVTVGLGTLQRVVALLGNRTRPPAVDARGLVVLMAAPGEQHTLAIQLLGELLRAEGWDTHVDPMLSPDALVALVGSERVTMVGITVSSEELAASLGPLIARVGRASTNPELHFLIGGGADLSAQARQMGATYCPSVAEAVRWLDRSGNGR